MIRAVFLDRDGTMNQDTKGYISKPQDFNLFPFTPKAIKLLNTAGFLLFCVSNQSGIARGYFSVNSLKLIHKKLESKLLYEGAKLDKILYCPYFEGGLVDKYNKKSSLRKPDIGMFRLAQREYNFSTKDSFIIGDKPSDIEFGKRAGLKTILVLTGRGKQAFYERSVKPDFVCENLLVAAKLIKDFKRFVY